MRSSKSGALVAAVTFAAAIGIGGCSREEGTAEKAGKEIDAAAKAAADAATKASAAAKQAAEDAAKAAADAAEAAKNAAKDVVGTVADGTKAADAGERQAD
jgi:colicin import membrane protein